jgi:hypothetical protein
LQLLEGDLVHLGVDFSLWAFMGQFISPQEKIVVNEIIKDRGIEVMMKDEFEPDAPAPAVDLSSLIGDNEPY